MHGGQPPAFSSSDILFLVRNHVAWNIMRTKSALDASVNGIAGRRIQKVSLKLKFLKPDLQCPDPSKEHCNSPALVAEGQGLE